MTKTIAVLSTLDTKGAESQYLREAIEARGSEALLVDLGVVGAPGTRPDVPREEVAEAGGTPLAKLLENPTRQDASPVMIAGATKLLSAAVEEGRVHGVVGLGGTQGTSNCCAVMQALPYGLPKVMLSTVASGDTSAFVGIKDITMMFSVGDILGLNPILRAMLTNAAGAACGMAEAAIPIEPRSAEKPLVGVTNLGVLTDGTLHAVELLAQAGYETIVFHAVGSGGRAMEQMMREGLIGAVFDYALGEIPDELFEGLRAADPSRLTVAGELGLPQVLCPGGAEHIGLLVEANVVPEKYRGHKHVFHNPIVFAPRLSEEQTRAVGREIAQRLGNTKGRAVMFFPRGGVSRYSVEGGPLHEPATDAALLEELERGLPDAVELVVRDEGAEDPAFVESAVARLVALMEERG